MDETMRQECHQHEILIHFSKTNIEHSLLQEKEQNSKTYQMQDVRYFLRTTRVECIYMDQYS